MVTSAAFIFILMCGALDRIRGDNKDLFGAGIFDKIAYSLLIALISGLLVEPNLILPFVALYSTGMSFGWGTPLGTFVRGNKEMDQTRLEWWQVGILKTDVTTAVCARGVLWGLPILPLAYWTPIVWAPFCAIVIAFPLAGLFARWADHDDKYQWEWMEVYRGLLNGALTLLFSYMLM